MTKAKKVALLQSTLIGLIELAGRTRLCYADKAKLFRSMIIDMLGVNERDDLSELAEQLQLQPRPPSEIAILLDVIDVIHRTR